MSSLIARRLRIHGRVQGVFYRESMRHEAQAGRITGWVRNRSDGTVEAVVQGEPPAVDALIAWARRGPSEAVVARVDVSDEPCAEFQRFEKRPTG